ncbi:MAG: hypothetical protein M0P33_09725 [Massilibacteroides sp.]|nr:hypothetical protein [Massilibacteroides sp.]
MKRIYILFTLMTFLVLTGCSVGRMTQTYGKADRAFLTFVSSHSGGGWVHVEVDHAIAFKAKVFREKKHAIKGKKYAIRPGKHRVAVYTKSGHRVYDRIIFVSTRETKKIVLP